jgi:hypothetical protein
MKQYQKRVRDQIPPTVIKANTDKLQVVLDREQEIAKESLKKGDKVDPPCT